jgi:hypothetical protein
MLSPVGVASLDSAVRKAQVSGGIGVLLQELARIATAAGLSAPTAQTPAASTGPRSRSRATLRPHMLAMQIRAGGRSFYPSVLGVRILLSIEMACRLECLSL